MGHVVSEDGVSTDPDKIKAIQEWSVPKNVKEVKSFLGLCGYYRKYVECFADIARPLHKACKQGKKLNWTEECQQAFERLKEALISPPILTYPVNGKEFILDTDASNVAVGAVLSQEIDGQECVVAYMSKALNKHEESYCTTRKELLAVVTALKNFHHYLYGQKIHLRTDNSAVSWLRSLKNPSGQIARWLQILGTYNMTITHRSGKKHSNADALSRAPCKTCQRQEMLNKSEEDTEQVESDHLAELQSLIDPNQRKIYKSAENNSKTEREKGPSHNPVELQQTDKNENGIELTQNSQQDEPVHEKVRAVTRSQQPEVRNSHLLMGWEPSTLRQQQLSDETIGPIMAAKEASQGRPAWESISAKQTHLKTLWSQWDRLELYDGMLYRKFEIEGTNGSKLQLILPNDKKQEVLKYHHDIPAAGHLGMEKTLDGKDLRKDQRKLLLAWNERIYTELLQGM